LAVCRSATVAKQFNKSTLEPKFCQIFCPQQKENASRATKSGNRGKDKDQTCRLLIVNN